MFKIRRTLTPFLAVLFVFCLAVTSSIAQKAGRSSSKSSSKSSASKSSSSSSGKTVHVKGYTRKDGTYVPPYDRAAPGTAGNTRSNSTGNSTRSSESGASVRTASRSRRVESATARDKNGKIKRSAFAKHEFMLMHPCPITGLTSGKCRGYVIDHINPLACGGADMPSNMQWQTKAEAKAKDQWERKGCR
jgi:hypothetical protein